MKLSAGDLVQMNPMTVRRVSLSCCVMVVAEVNDNSARLYVQKPGDDELRAGKRIYYNAAWNEFEPVGKAKWIAK